MHKSISSPALTSLNDYSEDKIKGSRKKRSFYGGRGGGSALTISLTVKEKRFFYVRPCRYIKLPYLHQVLSSWEIVVSFFLWIAPPVIVGSFILSFLFAGCAALLSLHEFAQVAKFAQCVKNFCLQATILFTLECFPSHCLYHSILCIDDQIPEG